MLMAIRGRVSGLWFSTASTNRDLLLVHLEDSRTTTHRLAYGGTQWSDPRITLDSRGRLWVYGAAGLYYTEPQAREVWKKVEHVGASLIVTALPGRDSPWFAFVSAYGGQSGFGLYQDGVWKQTVADLHRFLVSTDGGIVRYGLHASSGPDGVALFGAQDSFYVARESDVTNRGQVALPAGRQLFSGLVRDGAGHVWLEVVNTNNTTSVLRYRPARAPPGTLILAAAAEAGLDSTWHVQVRGVRKYGLQQEINPCRYSWRLDEQPWTPFQSFPAEGLDVRGLKSGRHRFQVRAQDAFFNVQEQPTELGFSVLPVPLQRRPWFQPAVAATFVLLAGLVALTIERARKLARVNGSLEEQIRVRQAAEEKLQATYEELRRTNERLEARVQERTSELGRTVAALQAEIAERRRTEEARRKLEAQVQQTQKLESLGVLAGGIAHDFNNLLTTILGNADLALMELAPTAAARESLREIVSAARRAGDLCLQMLAYSGRGRFVVENVDLSALAREMSQMLQVSISKKATLRLALAPVLPRVRADATQMRQVLMNLLLNASEALGDRPGVITIATASRLCDGRYLADSCLPDAPAEGLYVALEVADTGCGMDVGVQEKIFDPFFTTKFTGRGLGLAAVLGIVRGHQGAIRVQSEPSQGTVFTVLLPALPAESPGAVPQGTTPRPSWKGNGRLLLVDDEPGVRAIGKKVLERLGFEVLTAGDGRQAVGLFCRDPAAIRGVVLDLTMPELDGVETFLELKRIRPDLRALLASGYSESELAERFGQNGLDGFIQKPYSVEGLTHALRRIFEAAPLASGLSLPAAPGHGHVMTASQAQAAPLAPTEIVN